MEGYCVKCRAKVQMVGAKEVTMKNGKKAMDGKCAKCGTRVFKILRKYRRELVGSSHIDLEDDEKRKLKERFVFLEVKDRESMDVAVQCILKGEERSNRFFNQASSRIDNREGRIFLRLLAEEGLIHRSMVEELMEYANAREVRFSKNSAAIAAAARR